MSLFPTDTISAKLEKFLADQKVDAFLIIGDSLCNTDIYYLSHFFALDRYALLATKSITILVPGMERDRALSECSADEIASTSDYSIKDKIKNLKPEDAYIAVLKEFLRENEIESLAVPSTFPAGIYQGLVDEFKIIITESPILKWRSVKSEGEILAIESVQRSCEAAMKEAIHLIERSKPRGEYLYLDGAYLTVERVLSTIEITLLEHGCEAVDTIVAGGKHSAKPHGGGSGPLPANAPIVIDIFPRSRKTRYFADMTRTVVRGEADPEIEDIYKAVLEAQETGLEMIKSGITGKDVHARVCEVFEEKGYPEKDEKGFIHSTGHGVGLSLHELPSLSETGQMLETGNVVTVEPGLYYPDLGGVRLEDLTVVTSKGHCILTKFEKRLVLRR
jgi:Xaa-Pro aminopeptidase